MGWSPDPRRLAQLRDADKSGDGRIDLHYIGDGRYALGSVNDNSARREIAGSMKRRLERNPELPEAPRRWRLAYLHYQGFAIIEIYRIQGAPDGRIVVDFRERDWAYRQGREAQFKERLGESVGFSQLSSRESELIEAIQDRAADERKRLWRGQKISLPSSLTG